MGVQPQTLLLARVGFWEAVQQRKQARQANPARQAKLLEDCAPDHFSVNLLALSMPHCHVICSVQKALQVDGVVWAFLHAPHTTPSIWRAFCTVTSVASVTSKPDDCIGA